MMARVKRASVALGSNQPLGAQTPARTLEIALEALPARGVRVVAASRFFATPCFPAGSGPDYVNAAAVVETALDAPGLLAVLHDIEAGLGRERLVRWGQRTLDLDLLAMEDLVLPDAATQDRWRNLPPETQSRIAPETLILPHPRLQDRAFVLVPLADVAPDWRHPRLGLTVREMLDRLDPAEISAVKPL